MYNTHSLVEILPTKIKSVNKNSYQCIYNFNLKSITDEIQNKKLLCYLPAQDRSVCFLVDLPDIPNNLA